MPSGSGPLPGAFKSTNYGRTARPAAPFFSQTGTSGTASSRACLRTIVDIRVDSGEPEPPALLRLSRFLFPVPRRRGRRQRPDQPLGGFGHFVDRTVEDLVVRARRTIRAAQLA